MKVFVQVILLTFFFGFIVEWIRSSDNSVAEKLRSFKAQWLFLAAIIAVFVLTSYRRSDSFADTGSYLYNFSMFKGKTFQECWNVLSWDENNGFYFLTCFIKAFITTSKPEYLKVISILFYTVSVLLLYKYSKSMELSMFLYVCGGSYMASMNGMKQYAAALLIFAAVWMIEKKKWYLYFPFLFFFAMQFHRSSLVFFLVYIICNIDIKSHPKIRKNMPYIILLLGVLILISYPLTGHWISQLVEDTSYGGYSTSLEGGSSGSNPIRIITALIPFAIGMSYGKYIEPHEKYYHIFMCMCAFSVMFYMLGIVFVFYARFSIYFNLFVIPLMTWTVKYAPENDKKKLYFLLVVYYSLFFYFEMCISLNWTWNGAFYGVYK